MFITEIVPFLGTLLSVRFQEKAPRPGDRLPFLMIQEKDKLAKVTAPAFHLLLFPGIHNEEKINRIRSIFEEQNDGTHIETYY